MTFCWDCTLTTIYQFLRVTFLLSYHTITWFFSPLNWLEVSFSHCVSVICEPLARDSSLYVFSWRAAHDTAVRVSCLTYIFSFFHCTWCQFLRKVQCVPFKKTDTYPPLLPGAVWPVCFLLLTLQWANGPATPQLLPAANIMWLGYYAVGLERGRGMNPHS